MVQIMRRVFRNASSTSVALPAAGNVTEDAVGSGLWELAKKLKPGVGALYSRDSAPVNEIFSSSYAPLYCGPVCWRLGSAKEWFSKLLVAKNLKGLNFCCPASGDKTGADGREDQ
jgi:hypothetical protein